MSTFYGINHGIVSSWDFLKLDIYHEDSIVFKSKFYFLMSYTGNAKVCENEQYS